MSKKITLSLLTTLICCILINTAFAYQANYHLKGAPDHVYKGILKFNTIKLKLDKAEYLLDTKGSTAIDEIKKLNNESKGIGGVYIIDPTDGKVLVTPDTDKKYKKDHINGKVLAKEAIKNWQAAKRKGFWEEIGDAYASQYKDFFTRIAISEDGKVYVLAAGEKDIDVQSLFVIKLVNAACNLIKKVGIEDAFKMFSEKNSPFTFNTESYIFVYDENGVCLYNPNYPELVGKNVPEAKVKESNSMQKMIQIAKEQSEGWLQIQAKIPGTETIQTKEIHFKSIFSNGKTYIVGSGVYLDK